MMNILMEKSTIRMNYFEFYDLEIAFELDEAALRRQYLQLSKKYHPDFHSLASEEEQAEVLEKSTLNNQAYNTLKDFESRMQYILNLYGLLDEAKNKNALPQSFLMEMMDVNEALMELEFDFDAEQLQKLERNIQEIKNELYQTVEPQLKNFNPKTAEAEKMTPILEYYLKTKYINRLEGNLQKMEAENNA
jgi:molecular chaperone HscB